MTNEENLRSIETTGLVPVEIDLKLQLKRLWHANLLDRLSVDFDMHAICTHYHQPHCSNKGSIVNL